MKKLLAVIAVALCLFMFIPACANSGIRIEVRDCIVYSRQYGASNYGTYVNYSLEYSDSRGEMSRMRLLLEFYDRYGEVVSDRSFILYPENFQSEGDNTYSYSNYIVPEYAQSYSDLEIVRATLSVAEISSKNSDKVFVIVLGVVGGVAAAAMIGAFVWQIVAGFKKKRNGEK